MKTCFWTGSTYVFLVLASFSLSYANTNQTAVLEALELPNGQWHLAETENIQIISNCKPSISEKTGETVSKFIQHMRTVLPFRGRDGNWPLKIFLCKDQETFQFLAPENEKYQTHVSGLFTEGLGYDVIVIKANTQTTKLRQIVFHELVHRELRGIDGIPLWLDEGLAEVYSNFRFKGERINYALSDSSHRRWIQRMEMTSLHRLFNVTHSSPEYNIQPLSSAFYATAWAFVHYGLFGENQQNRQSFLSFAEFAKENFISESDFHRFFGKNYREMSDKLLSYVRSFRFPQSSSELNQTGPRLQFDWSSIENDLLPQLLAPATTLASRFDVAETLLSRAHKFAGENNKDPKAGANMQSEYALLNYRQGEYQKAFKHATLAYEQGDRSVTTLLIYAQSLLRIQPGQRIFYNEIPPLKDVNLAFRCTNKVLEISPRHPLACKLYTLGWIRTNQEPSAVQFKKLASNARIHTDRPDIVFLTVDLMMIHRKWSIARPLLEHFIQNTDLVSQVESAKTRLKQFPY